MATLITKRNGTIKLKKIVLDKLKYVESKLTSNSFNCDVNNFNIEIWKKQINQNINFDLTFCDCILRKPIGGISKPLFGSLNDFEIKKLKFLIKFYKNIRAQVNIRKKIVEKTLDGFLEEIVIAFLKNQISKSEFISCLFFLEIKFNQKMQLVNNTLKLYNIAIRNCNVEITNLQKAWQNDKYDIKIAILMSYRELLLYP